VCHLYIRFDERLNVRALPPADPDRQVTSQAGTSAKAQDVPLILAGGENWSYFPYRVPKSCSVEMPGHRQAGQFDCKFEFKALPIDPATVRAAKIEVHMGAVTPEDFAAGVAGQRAAGNLRPLRSQLQTSDETLLIHGVVDEWEGEYSASGVMEITCKGRDMRGLLLDSPLVSQNDDVSPVPKAGHQPARSKRSKVLDRLDYTQTIDLFVRQLLDEHGGLKDLQIVCPADEWPVDPQTNQPRIPSPVDTGCIPRHRRGAHGTRGRGGAGSGGGGGARRGMNADPNSLNYWDIIVNACYLCGAIPSFRGRQLHIHPARSIFSMVESDPGAQGSLRRLVYGRDVTSMKLARKFTGNNKPKVVHCIGQNDAAPRGQNRAVDVWFPPQRAGGTLNYTPGRRGATSPHMATAVDANANQASYSGRETHVETITIRVPGSYSVEQLARIARSNYEEIGRNEISGSCETKDLASFGRDWATPDLLRLRPGDPVELLVDSQSHGNSSPIASTLSQMADMPFDQAVAILRQTIPDESLCRVILATYRGSILGILRQFRVSNIKYTFDNAKSIGINFDFCNYFTPRYDIALSGDPANKNPRLIRRPPAGRSTTTTRPATPPAAPRRT
jgi:hypothetical protein